MIPRCRDCGWWEFGRITTISATNHIGHDHIGYRRNRPQTTSATAYTISATSKVHIGHRQLQRVTIGLRTARMPCEMRTDQNSNPRRLRPTDGLLKPTQATTVALNLEWLRHVPNFWGASARWRNGVALSLCQLISTKFRLQFLPRDASAERGNATVSRPSVCLSVRDV